MALFSTFKETIYVKDTSNIQSKINQLTEVKEEIVENQQQALELDLVYANLNLTIEKQMDYVLKSASIGMYVLHDINMKVNDLVKTIDYVIITPAHCYLIECKNMFGNIFVDERGTFHRTYELNGELKNEVMVSPYDEIMSIKEAVRKKWKDSQNIFTNLVSSGKFDEYYVPLVVFCYPNASLDTRRSPYVIRNHTIALSQLLAYLQRDLQQKDMFSLDSQKSMQEKANLFMDINAFKALDYTSQYTKKEKPKPKVDVTELMNRLINYRTLKALELGVPEHQIYTDIQIQQLLQLLPRDLIELQGSFILEQFRLDLHGANILAMIQGKEVVVEKKNSIEEVKETKVEADAILNPEQVLYVDQFATKIDIKNEAIVTNYGVSSIQKANTLLTTYDNNYASTKSIYESSLASFEEMLPSINNVRIELYMYVKAGKKALETSLSKELPTLKSNLDNYPGIANELAYTNYQKTLGIYEKQMKSLEEKYNKVESIYQLTVKLIETQKQVIELLNQY